MTNYLVVAGPLRDAADLLGEMEARGEMNGAKVLAFTDEAYAAAIGLLERCTPEQLDELALAQLRRIKMRVSGVAPPKPAPPKVPTL